MTTPTALYVIWSNQHALWWGPNERGYTPYLEEAGRYDLATARAIVAKSTLDGALVTFKPSRLPSNYRAVRVVDEHLLLAPESLAGLIEFASGGEFVTTPTDPTPTTPGTQTAAETLGTSDSANGASASASAAPASGPSATSPALGLDVALRDALLAVMPIDPDDGTTVVEIEGPDEAFVLWGSPVPVAERYMAAFADWLRANVDEIDIDRHSVRYLADLIDATVERGGSAPVAAGSTPAASTAGPAAKGPPEPAGPAD